MRSLRMMLIEMWRAVKFELLPTLGTFLTVFLALILPGIVWVASKNLTLIEARLRDNITVDVFLKSELTEEARIRLEKEFREIAGVTGATYISRELALQKMQGRFGQDMIQGLDENPLPASFVLKVDRTIFKQGAIETLAASLKTFPEVDDVVFAGEIVNRLGRIMRSVEMLGFALSILVAFAAVFIVANTVRLVISDRRKTVEIMQMVGATRGYILSPFVALGGLLGLL